MFDNLPVNAPHLPKLSHRFDQPEYLKDALTHRSAGSRNNERLEFLGDGVLNFVVAAILYELFPDAEEGQLSRMRARLVRKETLAEIARELNLGEYVVLGPGELKSGGFHRDSILANAFEAIVGAVYLDGGFSAAESFLENVYGERLGEEPAADELKDPKTRLQERLQARQLSLPEYVLVRTSGQEHQRMFDVECRITELGIRADGVGASRQKAEQASAEAVLAKLEQSGDPPPGSDD